MEQYLNLVADLYAMSYLDQDYPRSDRTGVNTFSVFGRSLRFNLRDGFPLLTAKRTHWKSVIGELLWFLRGTCNNLDLNSEGVTIWDEWADPETGDLGPIYGVQWRSWYGVDGRCHDQIQNLVDGLISDPMSRRHIVSAWNVSELDSMALPPCHYSFQCYVGSDYRLSMLVNIRSSDVFLGLPFNIASYAALVHILSTLTDYIPGELILNLGDAHLYANHRAAAAQLLSQSSRGTPDLPELYVDRNLASIDDITESDIQLVGYHPLPAIPASVAV